VGGQAFAFRTSNKWLVLMPVLQVSYSMLPGGSSR